MGDVVRLPQRCRSCGRWVEPMRRCYAIPTCYGCLPPPEPLAVATFGCPSCGEYDCDGAPRIGGACDVLVRSR